MKLCVTSALTAATVLDLLQCLFSSYFPFKLIIFGKFEFCSLMRRIPLVFLRFKEKNEARLKWQQVWLHPKRSEYQNLVSFMAPSSFLTDELQGCSFGCSLWTGLKSLSPLWLQKEFWLHKNLLKITFNSLSLLAFINPVVTFKSYWIKRQVVGKQQFMQQDFCIQSVLHPESATGGEVAHMLTHQVNWGIRTKSVNSCSPKAGVGVCPQDSEENEWNWGPTSLPVQSWNHRNQSGPEALGQVRVNWLELTEHCM